MKDLQKSIVNDQTTQEDEFSRRDFFKSAAVVAMGVGLAGTTQELSAAAAAEVVEVAVDEKPVDYLYHDSHVHLTSYVQEGTDIHDYLKIMGDKVGRSLLFGLPLQQKWSYLNSGDRAPTYYLHSDAPLYYYSFNDAMMAYEYGKLNEKEKERFDPMITGFNPTDMYAVDHIKRVLKMYPNTFVGLGEFSIHKEFVSSKISGEAASLDNKALDNIFDFAAEAGLVVLFHNDIDIPFGEKSPMPVYAKQMHDLLKRHKDTTVIWAHTGLGRIVKPHSRSDVHEHAEGDRNPNHIEILEYALKDPELSHLNYDISWDQVAKYIIATPETLQRTADMINKYPDRFLFGTDHVAPDPESYYSVYEMYQPLWDALTPEARKKILLTNYERIFDKAKVDVAAWEKKNNL
jgi:hypothetical protein